MNLFTKQTRVKDVIHYKVIVSSTGNVNKSSRNQQEKNWQTVDFCP